MLNNPLIRPTLASLQMLDPFNTKIVQQVAGTVARGANDNIPPSIALTGDEAHLGLADVKYDQGILHEDIAQNVRA